MKKCALNCSLSAGKLLSCYILKANKALQNIEDVPLLLQELLTDLEGLEKAATTVQTVCNTCHTRLCNYIIGFKTLQRQLHNALAIGPNTS